MLKSLLCISIIMNIAFLYVLLDQTRAANYASLSQAQPASKLLTDKPYQGQQQDTAQFNDADLLPNNLPSSHLPSIHLPVNIVQNKEIEPAFAALLGLANNKQWKKLEEPLRAFLQEHPLHTNALFLETQWIFYNEGELAGITAMYQLSEQINDAALQSEIQRFIASFSHSKIMRLTREQDWQNLAFFVEPLHALKPDSRAYIRALGMAYAYLNLPSAMEDTLANLPSDDTLVRYVRELWKNEFAAKEEDIVQRKSNNPSEIITMMDIIPLNMVQQQFFAPVSFAATGASFSAESIQTELLIDTGASITALTRTTFAQIPNRAKTFQRYIKVKTANGIVDSELYSVAEVRLGGQILSEVDILLLPDKVSQTDGFAGLLGMNILAQFTFFIDQDNALLELSELR